MTDMSCQARRTAVRVTFIAALLLSCGANLRISHACRYSVRDAGFTHSEGRPYQVFCFVNDKTPGKDAIASVFKEAEDGLLAESNVTAEVVNVDRQGRHGALAYLPSGAGKNEFPLVVLVSPDDRAMALPSGAFGARKSKEEMRSALEKVLSSPKREEIKTNVIEPWCVVLLVEGQDANENKRIRSAFTQASADMNDMVTEMGQTVESRPRLLSLSPKDPNEKILLWSLGIEEAGRRAGGDTQGVTPSSLPRRERQE